MAPAAADSLATTAPKPPNSTLVMDRFIALHIRMERMKPEKPSSVPAMINTLLERTKPVAAEERPAYELSRDITTGISAEPIGMTSNTPKTNAHAAMA